VVIDEKKKGTDKVFGLK